MWYKRYDIFISYRRKDGFDAAKLLADNLASRGYRVFIDVNKMKAGFYDEQLYNRIDEAKDVILICSPEYLGRCCEEEDWVRKEIVYAMERHKNILPFCLEGFSFPREEELPQELRRLPKYQMVRVNKLLYEECINKLCTYMEARPFWKELMKKAGIVCLVVVLSAASGGYCFYKKQEQLREEKQKIDASQASMADQYCAENLGNVNENTKTVLRVIEQSGSYLKVNADMFEFVRYCEKQKNAINGLQRIDYPKVEETFPGVDYCQELGKIADESFKYTEYIDFIKWLVKESSCKTEDKKAILDAVKEILNLRYTIALDYTYGAFLSVDNIFDVKASGKYRYNTILYIYDVTGISMTSDCVKNSLFGNSNENISEDKIKGILSFAKDQCDGQANIIKKIVGSKFEEFVEQEVI